MSQPATFTYATSRYFSAPMSRRKFSRHREPTPYLNGAALLRANFGLTQQEMANLLGVSRASVAMDERGERLISGAAGLRLRQLEQAVAPHLIAGPLPVPAGPPPALSAYECETLRLRLMGIELAAYPLRKQLARCQTRRAQAALRLRVLPVLRAAFPSDDARAQRWLEYFGDMAQLMLDEVGATPELLTLQLAVLAFEATETKRLLGDAA